MRAPPTPPSQIVITPPHHHPEIPRPGSQNTLRLTPSERMLVHIERPSRPVPIRPLGGRPMIEGNLVSSRQLKAARALAGLTQANLATEAGFNADACRYWECRGDGYPTTVQSTLDAIAAALERHGVVVFRHPTAGARLAKSALFPPQDSGRPVPIPSRNR